MSLVTGIQGPTITDIRLPRRVTYTCIGDLLGNYWRNFDCNFCGNTEMAGLTRIFEITDRANIGEFLS